MGVPNIGPLATGDEVPRFNRVAPKDSPTITTGATVETTTVGEFVYTVDTGSRPAMKVFWKVAGVNEPTERFAIGSFFGVFPFMSFTNGLATGDPGFLSTGLFIGGDGNLVCPSKILTSTQDVNGATTLTATVPNPSTPAAGSIKVFAKLRVGRPMLNVLTGSGREYPVQPFLGLNRIGTWAPNTTTTINTSGMAVTTVGTISHPVLASTSLLTSSKRWRVTTAATASSPGQNRTATTVCWRGNAAGLGGFHYVARVAIPIGSTNCRGFFGLSTTGAAFAGTTVPSALLNLVGFGWDSTETTLRVMHNDGAGTCTRVDLGANYPIGDTAAFFTLSLFSEQNGSRFYWRAVRDDTGTVTEGEITTDIPSTTSFYCPHLFITNGGDLQAVAFESTGVYIETDT